MTNAVAQTTRLIDELLGYLEGQWRHLRSHGFSKNDAIVFVNKNVRHWAAHYGQDVADAVRGRIKPTIDKDRKK